MDLFDLKNGIERGEPIEEIAAFLIRDLGEVRQKIANLGSAPPSDGEEDLGGV